LTTQVAWNSTVQCWPNLGQFGQHWTVEFQKNSLFQTLLSFVSFSGSQVTTNRKQSLNICLRSWCCN